MALPEFLTRWCSPPPPAVTRTLLPGRSWEPSTVAVPGVLPPGFVRTAPLPAVVRTAPGGDELRVRRLMVAAIGRFGWARCGGSL
ncbi:hypothetical protein [Streptomyces niveus]|uniref:hypothetical protein n=1 Tax=Streptomyces niveus TaxID=193462 RepID=UPI00344E68B9